MVKFDVAAALASCACAYFRLVVLSIPVVRTISCCETLCCNNVTTVFHFGGAKTSTPDPIVNSRSDDVLSP